MTKSAQRDEESHGGQVIGHTKSGKPIFHHRSPVYHLARSIGRKEPIGRQAIYESGAHYAKAFPSYSIADHEDAYLWHSMVASEEKNPIISQEHDEVALAHSDASFHLARQFQGD